MRREEQQAAFWYVHAAVGGRNVSLAVAAFTAVSARRQAQKLLGKGASIKEIVPVTYAHAWRIGSSKVSWGAGDGA